MLRFIQRTAGNSNEPLIFGMGASSRAFGDICSNTIRSPHGLLADSVSRKRRPTKCNFPHAIRHLLCEAVYTQVFEIGPRHSSAFILIAILQSTKYKARSTPA